MLRKPFTLEHALYALALVIAGLMRFYHLGAASLADVEASWALQALDLSRGLHPAIGSNPGYIHLTAALFAILGANDFWARFWPALAGFALVLAPWFARDRIGRLPALVLAFGLALDPGLNALSRMAGGPMPAIACLGLALALWLDERRIAAGIFAGLALLSGPAVWLGIFGLLLAWAFHTLLPSLARRKPPTGGLPLEAEPPGEESTSPEVTVTPAQEPEAGTALPEAAPQPPLPLFTRKELTWGLGTLLVVGSLLLLSPQGLAAFVKSFLDFASSWWTLSGVPLWQTFLALPAYELLPLAFGLVALGRGILRRDLLSTRLGLWLLAALLLALVHVGRAVSDVSWALLPLWALAALELGRHFDFSVANKWVLGGVFTVIFILLVLAWLTLTELTVFDPLSDQARLQWVFIAGLLLVIAIGLVLVGTGWSLNNARLGAVWGFLVPLVLFTIAMATGAAGVREPRTFDLWQPEPRLGRAELVLKVANRISSLNTGFEASLPLTIVSVDSPALLWLFRDWDVTDSNILSPQATPEIVITSSATDLGLTAGYRGEPLVWREVGDWYNASFATWLKWLIYRQVPVLREDIILWVRADLMLDSEGAPTP